MSSKSNGEKNETPVRKDEELRRAVKRMAEEYASNSELARETKSWDSLSGDGIEGDE